MNLFRRLLPPVAADSRCLRPGPPFHRRAYCRFAGIAGVCLPLLAGCLQTPAPEGSATLREAKRLESAASVQRTQVVPAQVREDLGRALQLYSLIDDTPGAVRIHLSMANLFERHGQPDRARREARMALELAREHGDGAYLYRALLTVGRLERDPAMFTQALDYAEDALQRAVVLTYLGRPTEAAGLVRGLTEPNDDQIGDLAFVLFAHAQDALDRAAAERTLGLYKREDNYLGIESSLRLLAHITAGLGDTTSAKNYEARARRVESALQHTSTRGSPARQDRAR